MFNAEFIKGAYRIVRDDGLVIAEVAGKNQLDPCSDGNLVAWASFADPQYVICSRTVDGSTLGPIIQQSVNTNEDAIRPFLANGWLFWSQLHTQFTTYAKNLATGQTIGPWLSHERCGGCWSWAATATKALACARLHWGKNYYTYHVTGIMFDFSAGSFVTFTPSNPDMLILSQAPFPNGLLIRNPDGTRPWEDRNSEVISVYVAAKGNDFSVKFSVNQHPFNITQATAWQMWERIVHADGTMEAGTMTDQVVVALDANKQAITEVPSWL